MLVADDRALQEQGHGTLLGVVEDLSEWTRLGRTSWLKCYDVLGYGNADKGARRSWRWCFPRRKHWPTRGRTGSGSRPRRAEPFSRRLRNAIQKAEPQRFRFLCLGRDGLLNVLYTIPCCGCQGPVLGLSLALFQLRQGPGCSPRRASGIRGCY